MRAQHLMQVLKFAHVDPEACDHGGWNRERAPTQGGAVLGERDVGGPLVDHASGAGDQAERLEALEHGR